MSGNDTRKLSETFAKPAEYKGTEEDYNNEVLKLADAFRYSNPYADRGFQKGGLYYPVNPAHVKRAVELTAPAQTQSLSATFAKPAEFKGTQKQYEDKLDEAAREFPHGIDADGVRYWVQDVGLRAEHISARAKQLNGPK